MWVIDDEEENLKRWKRKIHIGDIPNLVDPEHPPLEVVLLVNPFLHPRALVVGQALVSPVGSVAQQLWGNR